MAVNESHDVVGCARCGEDHEGLEFAQFTRPIVVVMDGVDGHVRYGHWATCPTTGEPILMRWVPFGSAAYARAKRRR